MLKKLCALSRVVSSSYMGKTLKMYRLVALLRSGMETQRAEVSTLKEVK